MQKVLFINFSKRGEHCYSDASVRYRCIFPAEYFISLGINSHVVHFNQLKWIELSNYSHFIFHRPVYSHKLSSILKNLNSLKVKIFADIDDLLFDHNAKNISPAVLSGKISPKLAEKNALNSFKALSLFKHIICSTTPLTKVAKQYFPEKRISTCFNKLPRRCINKNLIQSDKVRFDKKIIRYLPGTSHHQHDFISILKWLRELLFKHPNIHLEIIGDIKLNDTQFPPKQISQLPVVSFEQLPKLIADSWLTIAPLDKNLFNQCKSGLKFWESALMHIPVISNYLPDMERFSCKGLCLFDDVNEWTSYVKNMMDFEQYKLASKSANLMAQLAIYNDPNVRHNEFDERLEILDLATVNSKEPNKLDIKIDHCLTHTIMSAQFGYQWPLYRVNPTNSHYQHIESAYNLASAGIIRLNDNDTICWSLISKKEQITLLKQLIDKAEEKSKIKKSQIDVIKRKYLKLINSPHAFFTDSKVFPSSLGKIFHQ